MIKTVKQIVKEYLIEHKYDGLFSDNECSCEKDDLFPCDDAFSDCSPGFKMACDCGWGCDFHIGPEKKG